MSNKLVFVKDDGRGQITAVTDRVKQDISLKSIALFRYLHWYNDARYLVVGTLCTNYHDPSFGDPIGSIKGFTPAEYRQAVMGLHEVYDRIYIVVMRDAFIPSNFDFTPTIYAHGDEYRIEVGAIRDGWVTIQTTFGSLQDIIDVAQKVPDATKVNFRVKYGRYLECNLSTPDIISFLLCHSADFVR